MPLRFSTTWPSLSAVTRLGERYHRRHDLITTHPADSRVKDPSDGGAAAQTVLHKVKVLLLSKIKIFSLLLNQWHFHIQFSLLALIQLLKLLCAAHSYISEGFFNGNMETWCWDEALKLYNNTMLTAAVVWWHWLWHQCEEEVGDDIIHRRLKHSDYFRLGKEKEKEPWWRHLSFYKALRYFKIGRMRKPAERADHELHRYTSSSPARWSSVTCWALRLNVDVLLLQTCSAAPSWNTAPPTAPTRTEWRTDWRSSSPDVRPWRRCRRKDSSKVSASSLLSESPTYDFK